MSGSSSLVMRVDDEDCAAEDSSVLIDCVSDCADTAGMVRQKYISGCACECGMIKRTIYSGRIGSDFTQRQRGQPPERR